MFHIFIVFGREILWLCSIWTGSALFLNVPKTGFQSKKGLKAIFKRFAPVSVDSPFSECKNADKDQKIICDLRNIGAWGKLCIWYI